MTDIEKSPSDLAVEEALALHRSGRFVEAERTYRNVLADDPDHVSANHLMGVIRLQTDRTDEAISFLEKAADAEPENATYLGNLGNAYLGADRVDDALAVLRKARVLAPDDPDTAFNLGNALLRTSELEEAAIEFQAAHEGDPGAADIMINLGVTLFQLRRWKEAGAVLAKACEARPEDIGLQLRLADTLAQLGDLVHAREIIDRAAQASTDSDPSVLRILGRISLLESDGDKASTYLERCVEANQDDLRAWLDLGRAHRLVGRDRDAMNAFRRAAALAPDSAEPLMEQGSTYLGQDQIASARTAFEAALEKAPQFLPASLGVARVTAAETGSDGAFKLLEDLANKFPDEAAVWLTVADIADGHGDTRRAEDARKRASALDPRLGAVLAELPDAGSLN